MKPGDKVKYENKWPGTVITLFTHPQTGVPVAVVDFGTDPDLQIVEPDFFWNGNMLPIATEFLSPE